MDLESLAAMLMADHREACACRIDYSSTSRRARRPARACPGPTRILVYYTVHIEYNIKSVQFWLTLFMCVHTASKRNTKTSSDQ